MNPVVVDDVGLRGSGEAEERGGQTGCDDGSESELLHLSAFFVSLRALFVPSDCLNTVVRGLIPLAEIDRRLAETATQYDAQMAKLELSRSLSMTPDDAWAHASNFSTLGDWLKMHEGWRSELPDELEIGTTLIGVAGVKGMRNRVTWTVKELDAPTLLAVTGKGVGGTRYGLKMTVKPTESGCEFTVKIDLGGAPLFGPIGATAARLVKGDIERSIEKFEELYT